MGGRLDAVCYTGYKTTKPHRGGVRRTGRATNTFQSVVREDQGSLTEFVSRLSPHYGQLATQQALLKNKFSSLDLPSPSQACTSVRARNALSRSVCVVLPSAAGLLPTALMSGPGG